MRFLRYVAVLCLMANVSIVNAGMQVTGAGSSFIYPVLAKWAEQYNITTGIQINYQPIGSGGGVRAIEAKTVVFAATDQPLNMTELNHYNLMQAPMIVGGIVPVVNIAGVKNNALVLSGAVLAEIYLGTIKMWDDSAIKKLNPKIALPHAQIITVHRSDGSGTTFNFTNYLAAVSPAWKKTVGASSMVAWPGVGLGAKGNAGVASQVQNIPNSIGYVEYAFATKSTMVITRMLNRSGRDVKASNVTFAAAAENAKWSESNGFYQILTNQHGVMSWPIVATTFVLIPKYTNTVEQRNAAIKFLEWSYENGHHMAQELDYVAIPPAVYNKVIKGWKKITYIKQKK